MSKTICRATTRERYPDSLPQSKETFASLFSEEWIESPEDIAKLVEKFR